MRIRVTSSVTIDDRDIEERFVRSSGPGGQNVNKLSTAVQLRYDPAGLPGWVRARLPHLPGVRLTESGAIQIEASRHRTQSQNRREALERLVDVVRQATVRPRPRKNTRPTAASKKRRLEAKQRRGAVKRSRGRVRSADDG